MSSIDTNQALAGVFAELADGLQVPGDAVILNSGDLGLVRSLAKLSAANASQSTDGGATIAAHAQHLRFGLSLLNRWAREGGDPFSDAKWDEPWKTSIVDDREWEAIQAGLREEAHGWLETLASLPPAGTRDLRWMIGSIAHLAYHLGAIRQIHKAPRGPREGTFAPPTAAV
jgi:hypothetical protein